MNPVFYLLLLCVFIGSGLGKDYFIASEEVDWDYAPNGHLETTKEGQRAAKFYLNKDRHRIGSLYKKAVFVEYDDDSFSRRVERPHWLGYLGPILRAELGETLVIHFKNNARGNFSIHAHGVFYGKGSEVSVLADLFCYVLRRRKALIFLLGFSVAFALYLFYRL